MCMSACSCLIVHIVCHTSPKKKAVSCDSPLLLLISSFFMCGSCWASTQCQTPWSTLHYFIWCPQFHSNISSTDRTNFKWGSLRGFATCNTECWIHVLLLPELGTIMILISVMRSIGLRLYSNGNCIHPHGLACHVSSLASPTCERLKNICRCWIVKIGTQT